MRIGAEGRKDSPKEKPTPQRLSGGRTKANYGCQIMRPSGERSFKKKGKKMDIEGTFFVILLILAVGPTMISLTIWTIRETWFSEPKWKRYS